MAPNNWVWNGLKDTPLSIAFWVVQMIVEWRVVNQLQQTQQQIDVYSSGDNVLVLDVGNATLMQVSLKFQVPQAGIGVYAIRKDLS
jgi:hypothetical protein